MHSNHEELTMTCSEDWLQAAHTPMIIPCLAAHMTIGGHCWMGDDHVLLFFGLCAVFLFCTNCADRSSVANTTIDQFFIPELHVQVGIDDVSAEASDPCLHQHKININFLYEHN